MRESRAHHRNPRTGRGNQAPIGVRTRASVYDGGTQAKGYRKAGADGADSLIGGIGFWHRCKRGQEFYNESCRCRNCHKSRLVPKMFAITSVCKGGGYLYARTSPPHPRRNSKGLYPLHRVVAENKLGRLLLPGEVVHHINGDKNDNADGNLEVMQNDAHSKAHARKAPQVECVCGHCGKAFLMLARTHRRRGPARFCSRACVYDSLRAKRETRPCAECAMPITLTPGRMRSRFNRCDSLLGMCCSKECRGKLQARHHI